MLLGAHSRFFDKFMTRYMLLTIKLVKNFQHRTNKKLIRISQNSSEKGKNDQNVRIK